MGILAPMIIMGGIFYVTWELLYLDIFQMDFQYINGYIFLYGREDWSELSKGFFQSLYIFEGIVFLLGFVLFLGGLISLAISKKNNIDIAQTGPYKYIRHPQNVGIILMILSLSLYLPGLTDLHIRLPFLKIHFADFGIRPADILSWGLIVIESIIFSDIEEKSMLKKFPDEYRKYMATTGYYFPKIFQRKQRKEISKKKYYIFRYLIILIIYVLFAFAVYYSCLILDEKYPHLFYNGW